jgi:3-hydroxyisobutyrate dehydrogenase-like beta-hydroxyacid dehydrogenase
VITSIGLETARKEMKRVAILGVGKMGAAVAKELSKSGHSVILWNRSKEMTESLAAQFPNVSVATSPRNALKDADVAITFFASGPVTESVLLDDLSVLEDSKKSLIIVDMGTSGLETAQKLGAAIAKMGRKFIDCPVSGSVATIQSHQLLIMASGDKSAIREVESVLTVFAKKVIHVGDVGAGQVMKLVVNSVVHALNIAVAEGLTLASTFNLDLNSVYDVLQESVVAAPYVLYKRNAFLNPDTPVTMRIDTAAKDIGLVLNLAQSKGLHLAIAEAVAGIYSGATDSGFGEADMAAITRPISE